MNSITPEMARKELARRELSRREQSSQQNQEKEESPYNILPKNQEEVHKGLQKTFDTLPFLMPGGVTGAGLKAAHSIPFISNALKAASEGLSTRPVLNVLSKLGRGSAENAIMGATNDKEDRLKGAGIGAGIGAGAEGLSQLARTRNPIVNMLARAGLGGGIGYGLGGAGGAGAGAALGAGAPTIAKSFGIGGMTPGFETLKDINKEDVIPKVEAANRLGTPLRPSEATGNEYLGGVEGRYGRSGEAASEKAKIGMERIGQQKKAINSLLNDIYDNTPISSNKIKGLYNDAYQSNLDTEVINKLKEDPVISHAFDQVKNDKIWQRKLKDTPENNYAYLDKVKKIISNEEGKLIKSGEKERAAELTDARTQMTDIMDESNPKYKEAREEAQKKIIRNQIEKKMKKKEIKGTNFYNTFIRNENEFNKLVGDLKNVPEAQEKLRDMKTAWDNLIDVGKPRNKAFSSESGVGERRNWFTQLVDLYHDMVGNEKNVSALKFIHSPDWIKKIDEVQKIKDKKLREEGIINLIGKAITKSSTDE